MQLASKKAFLVLIIAVVVLSGCGGPTGDAQTHLEAGRAHMEAGQWDEAIAEFEAAVRLDPSSAEAHFQLGNAYTHKGRLDEAA